MTNEKLDRARAEEAAKRIKNLGTYGGSLPVYSISAITEAARLAREGWTPPAAVDPDIAEAVKIYQNSLASELIGMTLAGIKRGRALAAAEAKPGLVWVKHDGSEECPVSVDQYVWVRSFGYPPHAAKARNIDWRFITHYAIITPPEDAA